MALSPLAAVSSQFCCLSFWGFWSTTWASFTHCECSASSCLFFFWLALLTDLLLPVSKKKTVEPKEARDSPSFLESSVLQEKFSILLSSRWQRTPCGQLEFPLRFSDTLCLMFTWWVCFLFFAGNRYCFIQENFLEEQDGSG